MSVSQGTARWEGSLKEGRGNMKPAHASELPFSLGTRFEGQQGTNPEELIGAALAGCFSMALSAALGKENITPKLIDTQAKVHLDREGQGFKITKIELTTNANIPGIEKARFDQIADETKRTCPVSQALAGTNIVLQANLQS